MLRAAQAESGSVASFLGDILPASAPAFSRCCQLRRRESRRVLSSVSRPRKSEQQLCSRTVDATGDTLPLYGVGRINPRCGILRTIPRPARREIFHQQSSRDGLKHRYRHASI